MTSVQGKHSCDSWKDNIYYQLIKVKQSFDGYYIIIHSHLTEGLNGVTDNWEIA